MPRIARIVVPGVAHHVAQRGNRKQNVFYQTQDYSVYLAFLARYSRENKVKIWAFCLMPNHIHLVVVPEDLRGLAKTLRDAHSRFSAYVNGCNNWTGHLWQSRYFSCPMDESHLWAAVKYVELNPLRARMVTRPEDYRWSSAQLHLEADRNDTRRDTGLVAMDCPLLDVVKDWRRWLRDGLPAELVNKMRVRTRTGNPLGDNDFVARIEGILGRRVRPKKMGRPRKSGKPVPRAPRERCLSPRGGRECGGRRVGLES